MSDEMTSGTLKVGEYHPAADDAYEWLKHHILSDFQNVGMLQEALASTGIEGNRLAEICSETFSRLLEGKPVSDRYLLGLAWTIRNITEVPLS